MAESIYDIAQDQQIDNPYLNRFNFEIYAVRRCVENLSLSATVFHATAFSNMIDVAVKMLHTDVLQSEGRDTKYLIASCNFTGVYIHLFSAAENGLRPINYCRYARFLCVFFHNHFTF